MLFIPSWRKSQFGPCVRHWKVSGQHKDLSENLFSESDLKRQVWSLVTVTVWAIMVSKRMQKQRRSATSLNVAICTTKFAKHVWRRNPLAKTMTACLLTRISTQTLLIFWRNWITGTTWFHLHGSALGNPCQDTILELASGTQCTQFFWGRQKNFWHLVWVIGVDVGVLRGPICKNNCDGYHKDKKNVALKLDSDVHSKPSHLQTPG